jgi:uncharacterized protein (TIGR02996 family)
MRTFVFSDGKSNKFWNIALSGAEFTVTFGRVGTTGQTQAKQFASAAEAQKAHDKLVAEKLKKGYTETFPTPPAPPKVVTTEQKALEAALLAHPDEVAAHSAYADYLTEHDDPRGAFIQTQLALEDPARGKAERAALAKREAELLKAHAAEWMGGVAKYLHGEWSGAESIYEYRFARGWLDTVRVHPLHPPLFEALAQSPEVRMLRRLDVVYDMRYHFDRFDQFVEKMNASLPEDEQMDDEDWYFEDPAEIVSVLAASPYFTNLRVLKYGYSDDHKDGPSHSTMISAFESDPDAFLALLKACPRLEELYLNADLDRVDEVFASDLLGNLRVFQYYYGVGRYNNPASPYPLSALAENAALEHVHTLRFHPGRDADVDLDEFTALLNSPNLPELKHLQVHMGNFGDAGADAVVASGILKRLKSLDLGYGDLTDVGARALAACPDFKNLNTFVANYTGLTAAGVAALRATGVPIVADNLHSAANARDYRYSVDWE